MLQRATKSSYLFWKKRFKDFNTCTGIVGMKRLLHQPNRTQYFAGAGDQLLDAYLFRKGTEGEAHPLSDVKDGNPIAGFIGFLDLSLTAIEVGLTERAGDSNGVGSCLSCLPEDVV